MNEIKLMGRLTDDITLQKSSNDKVYAKFTIAVNRKLDKEKTDFINCVAFGKVAETIQKYTEKGNRLIVSGELNLDSYTNKDGKTIQTTTIVINDFYFVDYKKELTK